MDDKKIIYLCDRRKCDRCSDWCKHTSDITHAVNFKRNGYDFVEENSACEETYKPKYLKILKILKTNLMRYNDKIDDYMYEKHGVSVYQMNIYNKEENKLIIDWLNEKL